MALITSAPASPDWKPDLFWTLTAEKAIESLHSTGQGLTTAEATARLREEGENLLQPRQQHSDLHLFIAQFKSPLILILLLAAGLSAFLRDVTDFVIILAIVLISGVLGFWQERGAAQAIEKLLSIVQIRAAVIRDGIETEISVEEIVTGDVVMLTAGDIIPGDALILESRDLFVDEATLTGETYPAEKYGGVTPAEAGLAQRTNALFMGTHVVSGSARTLIVATGKTTEFGRVSERLQMSPPETEFEHGVRRFGYLLMEVTLILVIAIFAVNVYFRRPVLDSFLFALALAVGLTPQLLPAIIGINLSHGAKRMARKKVIVKRLASIENFGSMDVLCCDKTGTLTEGKVRVHSAFNVAGAESEKVKLYAYLNASFETGFANPIDEAIRAYWQFDISSYRKLDEVPYDFIRKRLSIVMSRTGKGNLLVSKGALSSILDICSLAEAQGESIVDIRSVRRQITERFETLSAEGYRVLGVAYKEIGKPLVAKADEHDMVFLGLIVFFDPAKEGIPATVRELKGLGISLKVITGDNKLAAAHLSRQIGFPHPKIITGADLHHISTEALFERVGRTDVFAEVEPQQKERIILALKKAGRTVGFMGDGINDASALHAADVGISVDSAVDVAKDAADIVLLEKDLSVLVDGVQEGRKTFANTLKYVFMATSANFGNMFSMAGASLFLPFLPLLPKQILLVNLLTDLPEMTIATDSVDDDMVRLPRRWDIRFIRNFMIVFGILSSVFDYLTFGILLYILGATEAQFRTGWFMESVISAALIVLVIRTGKPFFRSRPGKYLLSATGLVVVASAVFPYTFLGPVFGFTPIPLSFFPMLASIIVLYVAFAEIAKSIFYRKAGR